MFEYSKIHKELYNQWGKLRRTFIRVAIEQAGYNNIKDETVDEIINIYINSRHNV